MASDKITLPEGLLDGPAPNLTKETIHWHGLPEYKGKLAFVLDGVLSQEECDALVATVEATTGGEWERAMINIGGGLQRLSEETRKCGRIIWDSRELAAKLWARVEAAVPEIHKLHNQAGITGNGPAKRNETWKMTRLNERMRFLKYVGGEYFHIHGDGSYVTTDEGYEEISFFTLHLYLNDVEGKPGEKPLVGGSTTFYGWNMGDHLDVKPKAGRILIFQHRGLMHAGEEVEQGTKYTMRTDVMYAKET